MGVEVKGHANRKAIEAGSGDLVTVVNRVPKGFPGEGKTLQ